MSTPEKGPAGQDALRTWERQASAVLRKARRLAADSSDEKVWTSLAVTTVEGLAVPTLGIAERSPNRLDDGRRNGQTGGWDIRPQVVDSDASAAAETVFDEWKNNSTSLWLTVGGGGTDPATLGRALGQIPLDLFPLVLSAAGTTTDVQAAQALSDILRRRGLIPAAHGSLGGDPIGRLLRAGRHSAGSAIAAVIRDLATLAGELGIGALVADGVVAHRSGAGDAAEIGYVLAAGVHYLRELQELGHSISASLALIEIRLAATDEQFVTTAKFRAIRTLWARVTELSGGDTGRFQPIHAVTSGPMMTRYDPWTNLLRTTIAAFAAGVGGATSLTVQPFDSAIGIPDAHSRRLARNISALLIEEAHLADVADPAGGSWAIESLTDTIAAAAWDEFLLIEKAGGIIAALGDGSLRSRFAGTIATRTDRINDRRQPITGISEFPLMDEEPLARRPFFSDQPPGDRVLSNEPDGNPPEAKSWAAGYEAMRDRPAHGKVFVATLGPLAAHTARAGFIGNALTAGGIAYVAAGPTRTVDDVIGAYLEQPSAVVALAGRDADYADLGTGAISALRAAGVRWVILAGKPSGELTGLVDDHIAVGDDVLAFLARTRAALAPITVTAQEAVAR